MNNMFSDATTLSETPQDTATCLQMVNRLWQACPANLSMKIYLDASHNLSPPSVHNLTFHIHKETTEVTQYI